jgi:hypothetical protein
LSNRRDAHRSDLRRRQLQGERQPVQAGDEFADLRRLQDDPGAGGGGALGEEFGRVVGGQFGQWIGPLRGQAERDAARGQHRQARRAADQCGDEVGGRLHQVLAVVEHQQGRDRTDRVDQPGEQVGWARRDRTPRDRVPYAQCVRDLDRHRVRGGDARELDDMYDRLLGGAGDQVGQPGLAQPTRAND